MATHPTPLPIRSEMPALPASVGFCGTANPVFSLMTSFTWRCQDILYTSPRRGWRRRALVRGQNGVGNGGRRRTKGTFCGACEPAREEHAGIVPGVCDFASDRLRVVTTLP